MSNQTSSICQECQEAPEIKDWLFLAFHVVLVACLHWMAIDLTAKRQKLTQAVLTLHACAAGEVVLAASITVLLTHPAGILVLIFIKGQLISKCPYEESVSSKIPTKIFLDVCPEIFCSFLGASW